MRSLQSRLQLIIDVFNRLNGNVEDICVVTSACHAGLVDLVCRQTNHACPTLREPDIEVLVWCYSGGGLRVALVMFAKSAHE
jgi:hypothetical protein